MCWAAGGSAGLASAMVELPATVMVMFAAMQREAANAGFDPEAQDIRLACLDIFGSGRPGPGDDGINSTFLGARLTLNGPALQKLIATIAPRLATALGQKLAAQSVPVLGAVSGAAINAAFLNHYRELARIRFALLRLVALNGAEAVLPAFRAATAAPRITRA